MKRLKPIAVGILILLAFLFIQNQTSSIGAGDPDRYFHLALARETAQAHQLWLKSIPQITGLGWEQRYPDKEFLFHLINRALFAVGGDQAVLKLIPIASGLLTLALFGILSQVAGLWCGAGITLLGLIFDPYLMVRLGMLRPHLLAIFWFILFFPVLLRGSVLGAFCLGALYSWSYHSFYVPLLLLLIYAGVEQVQMWDPRSQRMRVLLWGSLGLLTGLIINPVFPGNLIMGFRHLVIALFEASSAQLDFGIELFPWTTEKFFRLYLPFCFLLIATPFLIRKKDSDFYWIWGSSVVFFALAARSPRAIEYAVPLALLLFARVFQELVATPRRAAIFFGLFFLSALPRIGQAVVFFSESAATKERPLTLVAELKKLPPPSSPSAIYNVEWDASPYIYYSQPRYEFVDILDPSFLDVYDKRHHEVRSTLKNGEVPDPWGVVQSLGRKGVKTRYLLTRHPLLIEQLRKDPHFTQVIPANAGSSDSFTDRVFELRSERDPHFIAEFEGAVVLRSGTKEQADALEEKSNRLPQEEIRPLIFLHEHPSRRDLGFDAPPVPSAYLDLKYGALARELGLSGLKGSGVSCVWTRPSKPERSKLKGKSILALGGGRSLRVWINGKRFFRSIAASETIAPLGRLVLLDRALQPSDTLEILVCSKDESKNFGLSMSLWTPAELEELCRARGWQPAQALQQRAGWTKVGEYQETCFGSYIR